MSPIFLFMLPIVVVFPLSLLLMFIYFNAFAMFSTALYIEFFAHSGYGFSELLAAVMAHFGLFEALTLIIKAVIGGTLIGLISLHSGWQVGDRFTDVTRAISSSTTSLLLLYFVLNIGLSLFAY